MTTALDLNEERAVRKAAVLRELREIPSYRRACEKVGVNVTTLRTWRMDDAVFASDCEAARLEGFRALEDEAVERGLFKGSDRLLMFMLAGYRPSIFGDAKDRLNQAHRPLEQLTEDQVEGAARAYLATLEAKRANTA